MSEKSSHIKKTPYLATAAAGLWLAISPPSCDAQQEETHDAVADVIDAHTKTPEATAALENIIKARARIVAQPKNKQQPPPLDPDEELAQNQDLAEKAVAGDYESATKLLNRIKDIPKHIVGEEYTEKIESFGLTYVEYRAMKNAVNLTELLNGVDMAEKTGLMLDFTKPEYLLDLRIEKIAYALLDQDQDPYNELFLKLSDMDREEMQTMAQSIFFSVQEAQKKKPWFCVGVTNQFPERFGFSPK